MNFASFGNVVGRAVSPTGSSRGSSPGTRNPRRPLEEDLLKHDKTYRRYAATIERTLATWEVAPEEWADYIAFLSRLQKALQSAGLDVKLLPHSNDIASKLAQCLNPGLPSGVHQKALEVYSYIFSTFGQDHVSNRLHEYLPGLCPLLSFAALSVRPALYDLLEDYIVCIPPDDLRPVLKSLILSLLPALEDETSEDFDRALSTIVKLERAFTQHEDHADLSSYFWQCVFLTIVTSPTRRQGGLNYLVRRMPRFIVPRTSSSDDEKLSPAAEIAISPEPGLLIRAFACGLSDSQALTQRGFLDLLVSHLPLDSPVLQQKVQDQDMQLLISATSGVLLRRDMSLNRRIWQWCLGPDPKDDNAEKSQQQLQFFQKFGSKHLEKCLLSAFAVNTIKVFERARPFRISLSLMDRWEVGGSLVPRIFLPAMISAYKFSQTASAAETTELLKSASLFFDGVESRLIWSKLFTLASTAKDDRSFENNFALLQWMLTTFNVREEEMMDTFAPLMTLYLLNRFAQSEATSSDSSNLVLSTITLLLQVVSGKTLSSYNAVNGDNNGTAASAVVDEQIVAFFTANTTSPTKMPFSSSALAHLLGARILDCLRKALHTHDSQVVIAVVNIAAFLIQQAPSTQHISGDQILDSIISYLDSSTRESTTIEFDVLQSFILLVSAIDSLQQSRDVAVRLRLVELEAQLTPLILGFISPSWTRYNVEAVRLIWRLDTILEDQDVVQASISMLIAETNTDPANTSTFLNLWTLSQTQQPTLSRSPAPGVSRRPSGSILALDSERSARRLNMLSKPLLNVLDSLEDKTCQGNEDVISWVNIGVNAESVVRILFDDLEACVRGLGLKDATSPKQHISRTRRDHIRLTAATLHRIELIFGNARPGFWAALESLQHTSRVEDVSGSAFNWLAHVCLDLLPGNDDLSIEIHQSAVSVLDYLLSSSNAVAGSILSTQFIVNLLAKLSACIKSSNTHLQAALLQLLSKVAVAAAKDVDLRHDRRNSVSAPRISVGNADAEDHRTSLPVQALVQLLRQGFASQSSFPYLDSWLAFVTDICPMLEDAILTILIPLTETICRQLGFVFSHLQLLAKDGPDQKMFSPDFTATRLLDVLSVLLQSAHGALHDDDSKHETQTDAPSTVLSSVTPNLFRAQAPQSKNAKVNSRLTVIIASKDIVNVCVHIWRWASSVAESPDIDRRSAASTAYTAMKLRNRSRHMLEEAFSIEPLESLEVVVLAWSDATTEAEKDTIVNLLHALHGRRPKNTLPAILDALCSRTNASTLAPARQSSLTSDLTASTLALFFSAYIESLEDDALDEIWTDCTAFYKDVLSNPLPYRQILPTLIWIVAQLARKLDNTNYGEQKRMRRELGDFFQRLIAATFASMPSGLIDASSSSENETSLAAGLKTLNLVVILKEIVARAELILETSDRISTFITAVSTNMITPTLRGKTFPSRVNADLLALVLRVAKKSPMSKAWRNDVGSALNDPRFTLCSASTVEKSWLPILEQWCFTDKERMNEVLSRLGPPSSAGIMFGVGANAARLDADRKTQLNIRRVCLLLLSAPSDSHVEHFRLIEEKTVELFEASSTSSPSLAVKAELFMLLRALLLSSTPTHFASFWPLVNDNLQAALGSMQSDETGARQNNLSLLQACKLLDLLAALSPDDFQLYEWIYMTNTTDAVYHAPGWSPTALSDQLADQLGSLHVEDSSPDNGERPTTPKADGIIRPLLRGGAGFDTQDIKAMPHDNFVAAALKPFLSQLSISAYENRYRMDKPDVGSFRHALLEDIQDAATVVA